MNQDERRRYWMALPYEVRKPWDETVVAMGRRGYSEEEKTRYIENRIKAYYGQKQGNPGRYDKYPKELYQFWNSKSVPQRKGWLRTKGADEGYAHFTFVNLPVVVKNWVLNAWKGNPGNPQRQLTEVDRPRMVGYISKRTGKPPLVITGLPLNKLIELFHKLS